MLVGGGMLDRLSVAIELEAPSAAARRRWMESISALAPPAASHARAAPPSRTATTDLEARLAAAARAGDDALVFSLLDAAKEESRVYELEPMRDGRRPRAAAGDDDEEVELAQVNVGGVFTPPGWGAGAPRDVQPLSV